MPAKRSSPGEQQQEAEPKPSAFQHALLLAGVTQHGGRVRLPKASAETLAVTYAALRSLEHRKLIEREAEGDPSVLSWKVTMAGKAAIGP